MKESFTVFYKEHYDELCRYVEKRLLQKDFTEDIVQDTFTVAWQKYDRLLVHPNQVGWLKLVAKYKIHEWERTLQHTVQMDEGWMKMGREEMEYRRKELELLLHQTFSKQELKRFERHFVWGFSHREMAKLEGITEANMRVRLCRMREKIRNLL
ncbi:MAG: sigma-70 family RNA polymerase sigma factor [Lachnospiraceae bacterium]|nr:sigma-70 family RNA polymerase sigma factor [Lachnospiraceae bacterium]